MEILLAKLFMTFKTFAIFIIIAATVAITCASTVNAEDRVVDSATIKGHIMCGYQGWFRCPNDAADMGWVHWSRDSKQLTPKILTFDMWPDLTEFPMAERFAALGFTHPDGSQGYLFSSDNAATVLRHFQWMRDADIDGAFLQHFLVDLPGGPAASRYPSRKRVMKHVAAAAAKTGRTWAISFDIAGMPGDGIYDVLTTEWQKLVNEKVTADARYLQEEGRPVVQIWGFFANDKNNAMTPELGEKLVKFFAAPGPSQAFLIGGGDWDWRKNPDPRMRTLYDRFDGYSPWNVGNYSDDEQGLKHATTSYWADDKAACEKRGALWLPVIYPGFSWDNLQQKPPGSTTIPRRRGEFYWEQFHALAKLKSTAVYIAMFDEVDEGTAIFKVTSQPPTQAHFVGYEDMPADWYLRVTAEGTKMLRGEITATEKIPIKP